MKSMDVFGIALSDYYKGEQKGDLKLISIDGKNEFVINLHDYFRNIETELLKVEKKLFECVSGETLDIGCGTAFYFPILEKKASGLKGIDISPKVIDIAKKMGFKNVEVKDFINDTCDKKYDTLTLLGNNLSMGGDINGTKRLLKKLKNTLTDNGQILAILNKEDNDYFIGEFKFLYNGIVSEFWKWIRFNLSFLGKMLEEEGLKLEVLDESDGKYCLKITRI